jgi:DNA-nicking Smr family endonuclease
LTDRDAISDVRVTLEALKATAIDEEATGFDASGSGAQHDDCSSTHTPESVSRETDMTSLSNALSSLHVDSDTSPARPEYDFESCELPTKLAMLREIFPSLSHYSISHTLALHDSSWKPAFDSLLNQVYFEQGGADDGEEKVSAKGIDAFSEENLPKRRPKGKKRAKNQKTLDTITTSPLPTESPASTNQWQTAKADVDFISDRANIPAHLVLSLYNQEDRSVARTISVILNTFLPEDCRLEDPEVQVEANILGQDFPSLAQDYLIALVKLTEPSIVAARELAKALTAKPPPRETGTRVIIPQYAPVRISDEDFALDTDTSTGDLASATMSATKLRAARKAAMEQARAAYRKSKSDRLMGGAAGYYSQVGRDHGAALHQSQAAVANAIVAAQSSAHEIDLHGVTVENAVRIARQRTNAWWIGLGENKINGRVGAAERANGFRIITGVGRHSAGGKGVLGPAVKKSLEQDGWRVEVNSGAITVKGKSR